MCLGASQTTGTYLLPRLISLYRQRNQEVALQLQVRPVRPWSCDSVKRAVILSVAAVVLLLSAMCVGSSSSTWPLQVDQSRRICDAVAGGQLDVAIIGGEVPEDLQASLKAVTYAEDQLVRLPSC